MRDRGWWWGCTVTGSSASCKSSQAACVHVACSTRQVEAMCQVQLLPGRILYQVSGTAGQCKLISGPAGQGLTVPLTGAFDKCNDAPTGQHPFVPVRVCLATRAAVQSLLPHLASCVTKSRRSSSVGPLLRLARVSRVALMLTRLGSTRA
jgi:hypothetical protein